MHETYYMFLITGLSFLNYIKARDLIQIKLHLIYFSALNIEDHKSRRRDLSLPFHKNEFPLHGIKVSSIEQPKTQILNGFHYCQNLFSLSFISRLNWGRPLSSAQELVRAFPLFFRTDIYCLFPSSLHWTSQNHSFSGRSSSYFDINMVCTNIIQK